MTPDSTESTGFGELDALKSITNPKPVADNYYPQHESGSVQDSTTGIKKHTGLKPKPRKENP